MKILWIKKVSFNNYLIITRVHQDTSRQGGANSENFKNSRGGGKLIGFNGQFLAKFPKFCLKFLKILAEILLKSQRGDQRKHFWETFLNLVQKNILWSPFEIFYRKTFSGGLHPTCTFPCETLTHKTYLKHP